MIICRLINNVDSKNTSTDLKPILDKGLFWDWRYDDID